MLAASVTVRGNPRRDKRRQINVFATSVRSGNELRSAFHRMPTLAEAEGLLNEKLKISFRFPNFYISYLITYLNRYTSLLSGIGRVYLSYE